MAYAETAFCMVVHSRLDHHLTDAAEQQVGEDAARRKGVALAFAVCSVRKHTSICSKKKQYPPSDFTITTNGSRPAISSNNEGLGGHARLDRPAGFLAYEQYETVHNI